MNIAVTGDTSTRDKNKLKGFIDAFSSLYHTDYFDPPLHRHISTNKTIDLLFGESGDFFNIPYRNIKNVFVWATLDIQSIANSNPNTNFYMCSKSILHDPVVIDEYLRRGFNVEYMKYGIEGVNLVDFLNRLEKGKKINNDLYQLTNNLYYLYLPCSLAQSNIRHTVNKDIDVTYFGTRNNRPNVLKALELLENRGLKVNYNRNNFISPEECIGYYNRSITTIHEQVGPVHLEYPVRQGECTMCNSKLFTISSFDTMKQFADVHETVPVYESFTNVNNLVDGVIQYIDEYKNGSNRYLHEKSNTYKHYATMMVNLCK
jgi:hypothetical protein